MNLTNKVMITKFIRQVEKYNKMLQTYFLINLRKIIVILENLQTETWYINKQMQE